MQKTDAGEDVGTLAAGACNVPFAQAWDELEGVGAHHSVADVVQVAAERHRELMSAAGLDREAPPSWDERAERLLEYRRGIGADVLEALVRAFERLGPTAQVEQALHAALERGAERCADLPGEVSAPWKADALAPHPLDGALRRFGKVFARVLSPARKAGRARPLPLRRVTTHHFDQVVVPAQDEAGVRALHAWGEWSRRLEMAWVEWGQEALPALVRAELPSSESDEGQSVWVAIREAGETLQASLEELLADDPRSHLSNAGRALLGMAHGALEADLAVAGSFLLRPGSPGAGAHLRRMALVIPALREWDEGVTARLRLYLSLLSILSGATAVQRRTVWRFRDRCLSDVEELTRIAAQLEDLGTELQRPGASELLETQPGQLDTTVEVTLGPAAGMLPEPEVVNGAVREISDSTIEALLSMIRQAPASLTVHAAGAKVPVGRRRAETRVIALQELARQAFDALRIERIRSATAGLIDVLDGARTAVSELGVVYSYARDEAIRGLESEEPDAREHAEDLVGGALLRIGEALRTQVGTLDDAVTAAQDRLAMEISDGSSALLERVGAGKMEARLFAARSRAADLWARLVDAWAPPFRRAWQAGKVRATRLRRIGARLLRKGSSIVGSTPSETAASTRTLKALTETRSLTEQLPLVYQRLFTLDPISDRALMAGREKELAEAMRRWRRWRESDGVPLIVRGRQGTGISSFLKVLAVEIQQDGGTVKHTTVKERITTEKQLARHLATPLGLLPQDSLDGLADAIFDAPESSLPAAVALDDLEHLYLRVPRGTDLLERLLTLMAETEPRVFWIGGITASAWQLVATAEPTAVSQIDVFDLPLLSAAAVREAIMVRHRRSGLAVRYEEPATRRHLLRRRLRRARDQEGYRQLLESDFFDQLYRASGGQLGLALYQWLLSADFESGEGVLMHHPDRPDFSVLEALDLTQNFTLKAFLEHRTLDLEDHDRIFRLPRHESYQIFESLRNRHLLEPMSASQDDAPSRSEIQDEVRYRVRPLLTGAVISHLQARNIVH